MTADCVPLRLCVITSVVPARLAKTITVAEDGVTLHKQSSASLTDGVAYHRVAAGLEGLAAVLDSLTPAQAVTYGLPARDGARIVTQAALREHPEAIARDREHFAFSSGPAVMMLDADYGGQNAAGARQYVMIACPALADAPMLVRPSSSAGIVRAGDGAVLSPLTKWHLYVPVTVGADIPDALARLVELLWACGVPFAWVEPSRAGTPIYRAIIDGSVGQPERLDFATAPTLGSGLTRPHVAAQLFGKTSVSFDLSRIVLDDATRALAATNRRKALAASQPALLAQRQRWTAEQAPRLAAVRGLSLDAAGAALRRAADQSELVGDFVVHLASGDDVTVAEMLREPEKYHGARMADPLDPEYGGGDPRIAVAYLTNRPRPIIYSHSHGGQEYVLSRDPAEVFAGSATPSPVCAPTLPAPPSALGPPVHSMLFDAGAKGWIDPALESVTDALQSDRSSVRIGRDAFLDQTVIAGSDSAWRAVSDTDMVRLRAELGRRGYKPVSPEIMRSAVILAADSNRFDSAQQWLTSLTWDGIPRVDSMMVTYFAAAPSPFARAVSVYLWTALAGRVIEPGIQADMALILVGIQGVRKTSALAALVPHRDAFAEIDLHKLGRQDAELSRRLRGALVCELAELKGLSSRDQESIKAWVSRRIERWRQNYQEHESSYPRRCVLIGTTNDDGFLDDSTGERRWLPIRVGAVDVAGLERDRDQLWAEGAHRFGLQGVAWQEAEALARAEHDQFKAADPWAERVETWLSERPGPGERPSLLPRSEGAFTVAARVKLVVA